MTAEEILKATFGVFALAHRAWHGVEMIADHVDRIKASDSNEYFGALQADLTDLAVLRTLCFVDGGKDRSWSVPHLVRDIANKPTVFVPVANEPSEAFLTAYGVSDRALSESRAERVGRL